MTKYIKCDEDFIDRAMRACGPCTTAVIGITELLEQESAADVVEVVRCKDCQFYNLVECYMDDIYSLSDNDFCSYGKRKEGAEK